MKECESLPDGMKTTLHPCLPPIQAVFASSKIHAASVFMLSNPSLVHPCCFFHAVSVHGVFVLSNPGRVRRERRRVRAFPSRPNMVHPIFSIKAEVRTRRMRARLDPRANDEAAKDHEDPRPAKDRERDRKIWGIKAGLGCVGRGE